MTGTKTVKLRGARRTRRTTKNTKSDWAKTNTVSRSIGQLMESYNRKQTSAASFGFPQPNVVIFVVLRVLCAPHPHIRTFAHLHIIALPPATHSPISFHLL